jgi:hypothetical protein
MKKTSTVRVNGGSLNQECGWKDGDKGGPPRMQGIRRKERENRKRKTHLTHTGLLMEGLRLCAITSVGLDRRKVNIQLVANEENQYRAQCG